MKYPELSISNLLYPKEDNLKRILAKKIYPEMDNSEFWPPFFVFTIFEFFYYRRMKVKLIMLQLKIHLLIYNHKFVFNQSTRLILNAKS